MWNKEILVNTLQNGGVAVMPTDTIYGIVGPALNEAAVSRIYDLRKRNPDKPCIILIANIGELEKFSIQISEDQRKVIESFSVPTSFILDCSREEFAYLHRGTETLAFRIPKVEELQNLLLQIGPLLAPSANIEGQPPAKNISEAKNYFGEDVDLYVDGGEIVGKPSRLVRLHKDGSVEVLRA